ncbi:MAG: RNA polymerase sporulation sigma factor SigF [Peptococcaceae bacterium]|nr:RNA polymerase sporulation sigma factor SigF [Peptococcaceae bacterium]
MAGRLSDMNLPRFPLLSNDEVQALLKQAKAGDDAARERLINCNLRLVFNLIQRFAGRGCEMEDLFQIGTIGLMKAIDKFDTTYDVRFSTYAVPMIVGEIRRFLRDDGPIKISRSLKETGIRIRYAQEQLTKELGRAPRLNEVAEKLELTPEQLTEALEATQYLTSIHEEVYQDNGDAIYVIDQLANQEDDSRFLEHMALGEVMERLPEREKHILYLRFFRDQTQTEVAKRIGISQVQVSRLERSALKKVREMLSG